ncbi:hypothetical protein FA13DRAFT_1805890 [Coprinellus micaceus]|uniref:Uncharacterized protein n=1 Tax=Coprinellus micaceus TaxID=71717 RepID=A0A4Y7RSB9_COPMI|nr:hypothetical protein FA13DRAFT_1806044 [Coprinellus micaceus]TEB12862.1 hypothetical protein FA13DRAFT_1805890 [Coprinellus micaceus]
MASFIDDDWNLLEQVIVFNALEDKDHEGVYAARAFIQAVAPREAATKLTSLLEDVAHFKARNPFSDLLFSVCLTAFFNINYMHVDPHPRVASKSLLGIILEA